MSNINEILARPAYKACSMYGAQMGRGNQVQGQPEKLYLQRVRFIDGDYDLSGCYWGSPANLWCAWSPEETVNDPPVMVFVRADSLKAAKVAVLDLFEEEHGWSFEWIRKANG